MTFHTTFLGHQGWCFRTDTTCIFVDPLLREDFGTAHHLDYRVWPPREWGELPRLDAVVLSHEHDDHFDIPSLAKLDRATPIYLSARSSSAARRILATMGFTVHPLVPGVKTEIGDLDVLPFAGDHVQSYCGEEWDTLPFAVRHRGGSGSFFTLVDIPLVPQLVEWARAAIARPGLVTWTVNSLDWSHMTDWMQPRLEATQQTFMKMGTGHKLISTTWGTPAAMLMCAGGFSFTGDRAWLNQRAFCVDKDAVCKAMAGVYRKEKFVATKPGQTFVMKANRLDKIEDRSSFLWTADLATWPSRAKAPGEVHDYAPATRRDLAPGELDELRGHLDRFAGELVGGAVFKSMHSLLASEHPRPTFSIVARDGDGKHAFDYAPADCKFVPGGEPAMAGLEAWGADLLAIFRGELGPLALSFGRARLWNALPKRFKFGIFDELHRISHPMRRPDAYLATYEKIYRECQASAAR